MSAPQTVVHRASPRSLALTVNRWAIIVVIALSFVGKILFRTAEPGLHVLVLDATPAARIVVLATEFALMLLLLFWPKSLPVALSLATYAVGICGVHLWGVLTGKHGCGCFGAVRAIADFEPLIAAVLAALISLHVMDVVLARTRGRSSNA